MGVALDVGLGLKLGLALKVGLGLKVLDWVGETVMEGEAEKVGDAVGEGVMEGVIVAVPRGPLGKRLCRGDLGSWGLRRVGLSSQSGKARTAAADTRKSSPRTGMDTLFFVTLPAGGFDKLASALG
jgi:hypothetical protein